MTSGVRALEFAVSDTGTPDRLVVAPAGVIEPGTDPANGPGRASCWAGSPHPPNAMTPATTARPNADFRGVRWPNAGQRASNNDADGLDTPNTATPLDEYSIKRWCHDSQPS